MIRADSVRHEQLRSDLDFRYQRAVLEWQIDRVDPLHCVLLIALLRACPEQESLALGVLSGSTHRFASKALTQSCLAELYHKRLVTIPVAALNADRLHALDGRAIASLPALLDLQDFPLVIPADAMTTQRDVLSQTLLNRVSQCIDRLRHDAAELFLDAATDDCIDVLLSEFETGRLDERWNTEDTRNAIREALQDFSLANVQNLCESHARFLLSRPQWTTRRQFGLLPKFLRRRRASALKGEWRFYSPTPRDSGTLLATLSELFELHDPVSLRSALLEL